MGDNDILDRRVGEVKTADDTVGIRVRIRWVDAVSAIRAFLYPGFVLPPGVTDKQLVDLMTACGNARERLRERNDDTR